MLRTLRTLGFVAAALALFCVCGPTEAPAVPKREIILPKKGPPQVDLMILLDVTGSMTAIKNVEQEVDAMVGYLRSAKIDVQVGLTVFRDELMRMPDDAVAGITDDPFTFRFKTGRHYTADTTEVKHILSLLKPNGGGDGPENSFEAMRLAADQIGRPGAIKVQILVTDAEPKPWPGYKENLAKTQTYLLTKKVQEMLLITPPQHRPVYQELWGKEGAFELRGEWQDLATLTTKPGLFRTMIGSLETRINARIADAEKRAAEGK